MRSWHAAFGAAYFVVNLRGSWQIDPEESAAVAATFAERRGFAMDVSHLTVVGLCVDCRARLDR